MTSSSSDQPPPNPSGQSQGPWWRSGLVWTAIGGVAAVLGVVVAIIPILSSDSAEPETGGGSVTAEPNVATSDESRPVSESDTPPATQSSETSSATLISTSTLEVTNDHFVDLETGAQVAGDTFNPPVGADLSFGNFGRIQSISPARMHQLIASTIDVCLRSVEADRDGIRSVFGEDLREGDSLCIKTADQNIAILKVTREPIGNYFEGGIEFSQELYRIS